MRALFKVLVAVLMSTLTAPTALAQVVVGSTVSPLSGAAAFCISFPDRCESQSPAVVEMTELRFAELYVVNHLVNETITYQREPPGIDIWQDRDFTEGDCEDFALLKRRKLISAKWDPGALRIAIVLRNWGDEELHAFLIAATDQGDFVLDIPAEDSEDIGAIRTWNPKEFAEVRMIWGADGAWYALGSDVKTVSGAQ